MEILVFWPEKNYGILILWTFELALIVKYMLRCIDFLTRLSVMF